MYTEFYNLKEQPFTISTEPRFLWLGEKHQEALANLKYGLLEADGYVVLTGDVGVGKTTLVNALLDEIDDSVLSATISHPTLPPEEFFRFLAKTWGGPKELQGKTDFLFFFKEFLERSRAEGKTILLIIDEAHRLSEELLEEIRLLSNMEQRGKRLVNIFFVGQIELKEMLLSPHFRALRQRITLFYDIEPFNIRETADYIMHRLRVAGGSTSIFSKEAIRQIHRFTKGYPRLINILCGRAMLTGYVQNKRRLDTAIVSECIEELGFLDPQAPGVSSSYRSEQQILREKVMLRGEDREPAANAESEVNEAKIERPVDGSRKKKLAPPRRRNRKKSRAAAVTVLFAGLAVVTALAWVTLTERGKEMAQELEITHWLPEISFSLPESIPLRPTSSPLPKKQAVTAAETDPVDEMADDPPSMDSADGGVQTTAAGGVQKVPAQEQEEKLTEGTDQFAEQAEPQEISASPSAQSNLAESVATAERASAALAQENYQSVIDMLAPVVEEGAENGELIQIYAQALVGRAEESMNSSPEQAQALLKKAITIDRSMARAHFLLGKIHTADDRYLDAIDAYQEAVRYDADSADTYFNLGFVYAATGKYEQAEYSFLRTVEIDPPYMGKALFNLAVVQNRLGKKNDSLENLRKARLHSPDNEKISAYMRRIEAELRSQP